MKALNILAALNTPIRPPSMDPVAARRWQLGLPQPSPWLHEEVARRMIERLDVIARPPATWCHWEPLRSGTQAHASLLARYPQADAWAVSESVLHAQVARQTWTYPWWRRARWSLPATREGTPPESSIDMLWANMALHMAADPQSVIRAWHRLLAVDGFLMFSCLGPDSLRRLRTVYSACGWPAPAHQFTDMHDWGDMLIQQGFGEPVMDMERITLSFETPQRLLMELRGLGRNLNLQRFAALRGRRWLHQLHAALAGLASPDEGGRLTLHFEIVYGHAIKPSQRLAVQAETAVPLDVMRAALRVGSATMSR